MSRLSRHLAVAAAAVIALGAGAAPALAHARDAHAESVKAATVLRAKIAADTPNVELRYQLHGSYHPFGRNASTSSGLAYFVHRVPVDAAQLPAKLEWILGVDTQVRGDHLLSLGLRDLASRHTQAGGRLVGAGLGDFRLSNYYIGQADTLLGVRHPTLSAAPFDPYKDRPGPSTAAVRPIVSINAQLSLGSTIKLGTRLITESIPEHLYLTDEFSLLGPDADACSYYAVLVERMHVSPAQRAAQGEWVMGVRAQQRGDRLLFLGLYHRGGSKAADDRDASTGLSTLRGADSEISRADAVLGIHQAEPSARLPKKVVYTN